MTTAEDRKRGAEAQQVLENPVYREAWTAIRDRLVSDLAAMEIAPERLARLQMMLALTYRLEAHFKRVIGEGAHAAQALSLEEQRKRRLRDALFFNR